LVDTLGIPLEIILERFEQENIVVQWQKFYDMGLKVGWNEQTVIDRMKYAIIDIYGIHYWEEVNKRLRR